MSPGAGLRPSPPPLLRTQPPLPPRVRPPRVVEVALWLDCPHAEPLRGWQAFGHSKGGGDRRRRATGDMCPNACRLRRGPEARDHIGRTRRIAGALEGEGAACECPPAPACGRHLLLYFARSSLSLRVSGLRAPVEVPLRLDPPQAEPLRGWQAFGHSKGGGDRRRRATGDMCPSACRSRRGPDARDHTCRNRRIAGAQEGKEAACECPPAPACGRHLLLYFARSPLSLRVSGLHASLKWRCGWTVRTPSRCVGGRRLDTVKEEATAAGGRRGTCVQMPATRAAALKLATTVTEATNKKPGFRRAFRFTGHGPAQAPYFFFGMYRSVIVPS